jgi:GNAT superfamily N-acetyltransferase
MVPDRHAGAGRALLDAAVTWARDHGLARLVLSPSERSVSFYRRAGFTHATNLLVLPLS